VKLLFVLLIALVLVATTKLIGAQVQAQTSGLSQGDCTQGEGIGCGFNGCPVPGEDIGCGIAPAAGGNQTTMEESGAYW
jgi:hypothetical protein